MFKFTNILELEIIKLMNYNYKSKIDIIDFPVSVIIATAVLVEYFDKIDVSLINQSEKAN